MTQRTPYLVGLFLLMIALLWLRFPDIFAHPNSGVIEPWGDGYKTYHALTYHAQHDTSLSHFAGMNYPYGDHVVPGDCQPLLSNGVKLLQHIGIDLSAHTFAVLHITLLLGLVLCTLFLFLILERLGLPLMYSLVVAVGLTFLAPQLDRMVSHFGLAHPELLPIVFYLLLRWHEQPHWKWSVALGLVVWLYSLFHFYFFAILGFTIGGFMVLRWLLQGERRQLLYYAGHGVLMVGLPLLFFFFWMIYNDPVLDRNPAPWGFFNYRSRLEGIFTHLSEPHWQFFDGLIPIRRVDMEANAYIGLVAMAFILVALAKWVGERFSIRKVLHALTQGRFLPILLLTATLILIFALGIPFIFPGGEKLLKYTGPIQQFRSIGRFAWVFFYAINLGAFCYLYHWVDRSSRLGKTLMYGALLVLVFEAYQYCWSKDLRLDPIEEFADGQAFTAIDSIDFSRYQAIVPIPYYNIGSGNFWWDLKGYTGQKSQTLSMQTGLPMTSAMLTRTSLSQTLKQFQLVTEPYRPMAILEDLPSDQPFVMLWDDLRVHEFGDRFLHLPLYSELIYRKDPLLLFELPLESFDCRLAAQLDTVALRLAALDTLEGGWLGRLSNNDWYYDGYDDQSSENVYLGDGGFQGTMSYWNRLVDTVWQSDYTGELIVSFWQFLNSDRSARTTLTWRELDPSTGEEIYRQEQHARELVQVFDPNGWGLLEWTIQRQQPDSRIELVLTNSELGDRPIYLDELLIRPSGAALGQLRADGLWWNNRWYPGDLLSTLSSDCAGKLR